MKEAFIRLFDAFVGLIKIKSVMTIGIMIVFVILALTNRMPIELTASIITAVITYYFTKKEEK
jgi:hypothetical protein